ncbi:hypothetical protein [Methanosarcina acetivorans]|uniref:hypothetical protein n=1 Tax=Methanosarcina acetivorans TaxID=2214 RepID=UPI00064ECC29|nr:hypothetical protein [Methanosarcina acetivorans]
MKNSAFDLDVTPENFVFNSTGQLLKGNEYYEQYTELAKQLYEKRSAFYLELRDNEIIFGCSLNVKENSGGEERIVFIQTYNNLPPQDISLDITSVKNVYKYIKSEIINLYSNMYQLVGLWEENDYINIRDRAISDDALKYTADRINSGKKVSVKISELNVGLSFVLKLVAILGYRYPLTFDVSQYSSNFDVSVSLTEPNPDFEIEKYRKYRKNNVEESWGFYNDLGGESLKHKVSNPEKSTAPSYSVDDRFKVELFHRFSNDVYNLDYGVYNSTGQLLKGNEHFEQYTELAKQLDTKRSAFYLESREDKIILGCGLSVKADNGREERVVFIHVHNNLPSQHKITDCEIQFLKKFYGRIKSEIKTIYSNKYQLVGLWEENDYKNIEDRVIKDDILIYTAGRINSGKKVSVKITDLSAGLSFVLKLVTLLGHRYPLMLDVSQYPSNSEVSVSLIKPNPDFEIKENGEYRIINAKESWDFYKELGEESVKNKTSGLKINKNSSDSVSLIVKKILKTPSDYYSSDKFIDNFDDREKVEIFKRLIQENSKTKGLTSDDRDKVEMFKKLVQEDSKINNPTSKVLTNIYHKIKSPECRKEIYEISLSNDVYVENLVKDLLRVIYKEHNRDLFNLLFDYSDNEIAQGYKKSSKYDSFKNEVEKSLKYLEDSDKVNFVKYIASEAPSKPKARGKILLKALIEDLVERKGNNDFLSKLSEEEAENLDKIIRDSNYLSSMKKMKKSKRDKKIKIASYAIIAIILVSILLMSYFVYIHPAGIDGENNSSINKSENDSIDLAMTSQGNNTNSSEEAVFLDRIKNRIISLIS